MPAKPVPMTQRSKVASEYEGVVAYYPAPQSVRSTASHLSMTSRGEPLRAIIRSLVPRRLRRRVRELTSHLNVPRDRPSVPDELSGRITLLGYLTSPTGLGEGARLAAEALADAGYTVGLVDATVTMNQPRGGQRLECTAGVGRRRRWRAVAGSASIRRISSLSSRA